MRVKGLLVVCVCVAWLLSPRAANAAVQTGAGATAVLVGQVADTLKALGDAIGGLTDGVAKLIKAGDTGWTAVSARRTHASLVDLSAALTGLAGEQRVRALPALEAYLRSPSQESWNLVRDTLRDVLTPATALLMRLDAERSDLVLQPAYVKLREAMLARVTLLDKLRSLPPPRSPNELTELRRALANYRDLVTRLESARNELNAYAQTVGAH